MITAILFPQAEEKAEQAEAEEKAEQAQTEEKATFDEQVRAVWGL